MESKRIDCIEGLRTIGWIGVFLCHFKLSFFPDLITWIDKTPLKFFYSGETLVRLFFVMSGLVISYKYFVNDRYDSALKDITKRYFRLVPPILFAEILVLILMSIGAMYNAEASVLIGSESFLGIHNQFKPDIGLCLREALLATYFNGSSAYIGPLWTMVYEYIGAIIIIAAVSIFKKSDCRWLFYGVFLIAYSGYYNYFVLGMMICDLYVNLNIWEKLKKKILPESIVVIGFVMLNMINLNDTDKYSRVVFGLGVVLFMLGILSSELLGKVLGCKPMIKGGEIAYSAYIIHWPVIETLSCGLMVLFYGDVNYNLLSIVICLVSFIFIVILAYLMKNYLNYS